MTDTKTRQIRDPGAAGQATGISDGTSPAAGTDRPREPGLKRPLYFRP